MSLIEGRTGGWEIVIGLEVHAQVATEAKLFSGASTAFGASPNSQVSLVDAAMPGMLPVINEAAIAQAVRTGLGLNAEINLVSVFDRKNYFYPDLPQGYQISQYTQPIVGKGEVTLEMPDGGTRSIGITRLHLEQDAGKSLHDQDPRATYVDLNRAGVALMEIVSEPDLRSAEEAALYVTKLRALLRYLGTCDGNMQEGSLRADANVSVRKPGDDYGTRCEIKNLNSIRFLRQAIDYEARRQVELVEDGGTVRQETRLWDDERGVTRPMRSKEEAHDYRYFPDPDLLPLELSEAEVAAIRDALPELPDAKRRRYLDAFGLSEDDATLLVAEPDIAAYYEAAADGRDAKTAANWMIGEVLPALNRGETEIAEAKIGADALGRLIDLVSDGAITRRIGRDVFEEMWQTGGEAEAIVDAKGLRSVTDTGAIEAIIDKAIADNPSQVEEFRGGKDKVFGFFVGQVMRATQGKADPKLVNDLLRTKLQG